MSILKLIAIAGILLGGVSFVLGLKQKSKKTIGLFVALIIASAALFVVAGIAENKLISNLKPQDSIAQTAQPAAAPELAEPSQDNDFTDDADVNAAPEVQAAAAPEVQAETAPEGQAEAAPEGQAEAALDFQLGDATAEGQADTAPEGQVAVAPEVQADADLDFQLDDATAEGQADAAPEVQADAAPEVQADAAPEVQADAAPEAQADAAPEVQAAAPTEPGKAPEFTNDPLAPLANAGANVKDAKLNESITFSAKASKKNPKGGAIVSSSWDFGDGTSDNNGNTKHAYSAQGTYYAVLTVTDDAGRSAKAVRTIEVYRPENKIKFTTKSLDDLKGVTASASTVGDKFEKTFQGSQITLEASGYMLAADHCKCELSVNLRGPGCTVKRAKSVKDGGEGDLTVKAQCKGEVGEYSWSVERKVESNCACTFQNIKLEGFES